MDEERLRDPGHVAAQQHAGAKEAAYQSRLQHLYRSNKLTREWLVIAEGKCCWLEGILKRRCAVVTSCLIAPKMHVWVSGWVVRWAGESRRRGWRRHLDVDIRGAESLPPAVEEVHEPKEYPPHGSAARWPDPISGYVQDKVPVQHLLQ